MTRKDPKPVGRVLPAFFANLRRMQVNDEAPKWLSAILTRRPDKVAAVALANKIPRIIRVLLTRGRTYQGFEAGKSAASV